MTPKLIAKYAALDDTSSDRSQAARTQIAPCGLREYYAVKTRTCRFVTIHTDKAYRVQQYLKQPQEDQLIRLEEQETLHLQPYYAIISSNQTSATAHFIGHLFAKTKTFTYFYIIMANHKHTTSP